MRFGRTRISHPLPRLRFSLLVPRIIHQIWVGPDPLPDEFASYIETWRHHHPKWTHRLWTEENLPTDLRHPEALERIRHPAERADILRLELLWRQGGVYVDADFECRRAMDPYIGDADFFTAWLKPRPEGKPGRVNNAFVGSVPGHPLLERALDELRPQECYGFDKSASGSVFFNALVHDFPEVRILPQKLIYPSSPAEEEAAISIHHYARSWADGRDFRKAAVRAEERLRAALGRLEESERAHAKTERRLNRTEARLNQVGESPTRASWLSRLLAR